MRTHAERRIFLVFLPAMILLAIPLLACGAGSGTVVEECRDAPSSEACNTCCSENGHNGHMYNSFSDPVCQCAL